MIKNILHLATIASICCIIFSCSDVEDLLRNYPTLAESGATYYIDSESGDDTNKGTSPEAPWKTLEKINQQTFVEGNTIALKAGSSFEGMIAPGGSGTASKPIIITSYGEGAKPIINANGADAGVKLINQSNWVIDGLEITNTAAQRDAYRSGILVLNENGGVVSNITIKNNKIHDVVGSFGYAGIYHPHSFGGIAVATYSEAATDKFDKVLIENNEVEKVGRSGIVVWDYIWGSNAESSTNVVIRHNSVKQSDSDGILTYGCNGALIEYNVCEAAGSYREDNQFNGSAGIWCTRGYGCIIQHNEAFNTRALEGNTDGTGFDIDIDSYDCIVQYNYSHDNDGGFMLFVDGHKDVGGEGSKNNIVRYNISQNDKERIFLFGGGVPASTQIYGNTIYIKEGLDTKIFDYSWETGGNINAKWSFQNNIIVNYGSGGYNIPGTGGSFAGNIYYGNHPASEPEEENKRTYDPMFVSPGNGTLGIASLDGYKLQEDSPAINDGVEIRKNGRKDFWGNPVSSKGALTIGAHEPNGNDDPDTVLFDPLEDWSIADSHSSHFGFDSSNPQYFNGDDSRIVRSANNDANVVYKYEGFKSATVTFSIGKYTSLGITDVSDLQLFEAESTEGPWSPISVQYSKVGKEVDGWQTYEAKINSVVSAGARYLKIEVKEKGDDIWGLQIGSVEIDSEEPIIAPVDKFLFDDFEDASKIAGASANMTIIYESPADAFNGDATRATRTNIAEGYVVYNTPEDITGFAVTSFVSMWAPVDEYVEILCGTTADPAQMTSIPFTRQDMGGTEWLGYRYIPANPLAPGYRYFAIRLKTLEVPEGNGWLVQLGSVKIEFE